MYLTWLNILKNTLLYQLKKNKLHLVPKIYELKSMKAHTALSGSLLGVVRSTTPEILLWVNEKITAKP
jgi:hypothetical protein